MKTIILDTETTGLINNSLVPLHHQPQIIEIFCLSLDDEGNELGSYGCLINPGKPLPAEIKKIVSITDDMLSDAPSFEAVAPEIKAFIEGHDIVVAHNLSYDMKMVTYEMMRARMAVKWPQLVCTVEQTIHIKGHRLSLTALYEYLFGEPFSGAHRAETDVRATARCYLELKKRGVV